MEKAHNTNSTKIQPQREAISSPKVAIHRCIIYLALQENKLYWNPRKENKSAEREGHKETINSGARWWNMMKTC